jgi:hypothetical protein
MLGRRLLNGAEARAPSTSLRERSFYEKPFYSFGTFLYLAFSFYYAASVHNP